MGLIEREPRKRRNGSIPERCWLMFFRLSCANNDGLADDPAWNYNARTLGGLLLLVFLDPGVGIQNSNLEIFRSLLESGLAFFLFGLDLKVHGWCNLCRG